MIQGPQLKGWEADWREIRVRTAHVDVDAVKILSAHSTAAAPKVYCKGANGGAIDLGERITA